jgi:hypothetical protein
MPWSVYGLCMRYYVFGELKMLWSDGDIKIVLRFDSVILRLVGRRLLSPLCSLTCIASALNMHIIVCRKKTHQTPWHTSLSQHKHKQSPWHYTYTHKNGSPSRPKSREATSHTTTNKRTHHTLTKTNRKRRHTIHNTDHTVEGTRVNEQEGRLG